MSKPYELVNFCEIDKYAAKSYCAVHDVDPGKNLGDITKVDENELPEFNCIFMDNLTDSLQDIVIIIAYFHIRLI